jgi:hypothetical protein
LIVHDRAQGFQRWKAYAAQSVYGSVLWRDFTWSGCHLHETVDGWGAAFAQDLKCEIRSFSFYVFCIEPRPLLKRSNVFQRWTFLDAPIYEIPDRGSLTSVAQPLHEEWKGVGPHEQDRFGRVRRVAVWSEVLAVHVGQSFDPGAERVTSVVRFARAEQEGGENGGKDGERHGGEERPSASVDKCKA